MKRNTKSITRPKIRRLKNFNYKSIIIGIVALLIIAVIYVVFFTGLFRSKNYIYKINVSENASFSTRSSKELYYFDDSSLKAIDHKGSLLWTIKFTTGDMNLCAGANILCLYNSSTATVLDTNKNILFNVSKSDFKISKVSCGKNLLALYCTLSDSSNTYLRIFNFSGNEIDRIELSGNCFLDFGFYGESDNLWYMILDTTGVEPITKIITSIPSQQKSTGLYEIYDYLVSNVCFDNSNLFVNTTASLQVYDSIGNLFYEKMIYGNQLVDVLSNNDNIIFAYTPYSEYSSSSSTLRVLSLNGLDTLILLPSGVSDVALSSKCIYCFANDSIYLYNYKGEFSDTISLGFAVDSIEKVSSNFVILHSGGDTYMLYLD